MVCMADSGRASIKTQCQDFFEVSCALELRQVSLKTEIFFSSQGKHLSATCYLSNGLSARSDILNLTKNFVV